VRFGNVCSEWRDIILSTPGLWSNFTFNCAQFTNSRFALYVKKIQRNTSMCTHAYSTRCLLVNLVILVVLVVLGRESDITGRYIHSFSEFPPKGFIEGLLPSPKARIGRIWVPQGRSIILGADHLIKTPLWLTDLYSLSVPISLSFML